MREPGAGRIWRVAVLAAMSVGVLLSACTAKGSDAARPELPERTDPGPDTTVRETTTTTTAASSGEPMAFCTALPAVLPAADLSRDSGPDFTDDEYIRAFEAVASEAPAKDASAWAEVIRLLRKGLAHPESVTDAEGAAGLRTIQTAASWAPARCPDYGHAWKCSTQAKFEKVGQSLDPDEEAPPTTTGAPTPESVLARFDDRGQAVELDRSSDAVLYGWLDANGAVERTERIDRVDGRWQVGESLSCREPGGG